VPLVTLAQEGRTVAAEACLAEALETDACCRCDSVRDCGSREGSCDAAA
jgi:hypothetical protein